MTFAVWQGREVCGGKGVWLGGGGGEKYVKASKSDEIILQEPARW